jgi:hypothetical protein
VDPIDAPHKLCFGDLGITAKASVQRRREMIACRVAAEVAMLDEAPSVIAYVEIPLKP